MVVATGLTIVHHNTLLRNNSESESIWHLAQIVIWLLFGSVCSKVQRQCLLKCHIYQETSSHGWLRFQFYSCSRWCYGLALGLSCLPKWMRKIHQMLLISFIDNCQTVINIITLSKTNWWNCISCTVAIYILS